MPLGSNLGGENSNRKNSKSENTDMGYLTTRQVNYVYSKVESGNLINKNVMRQETDQDIELDKMDDTNGDENPYRALIVNNVPKIEITLSEMEQWSILSNVINYAQYDKHPKSFHTISIKHVKKVRNKAKSRQKEKERPISEVEFKNTSDRLKEEYLDRYKGVKLEY